MALLENAPRAATVTAITPMTLLVLSSREFEALLRASPGVARRIMAALSARVRHANGLGCR